MTNTELDPEIVERAREAIKYIHIDNNGGYSSAKKWVEPTKWFVIDGRTAEPDVNWPGELLEEYNTQEDAVSGKAKYIALAIIHPKVRA